MGKTWKQWQILFSWAPKSLWMGTTAMKFKKKSTFSLSYDNAAVAAAAKSLQSCPTLCDPKHIKKQTHLLCWPSSIYSKLWFSSSHVQMWELNHKEGWAPKNQCFRIVLLEETLENPLDNKEIKLVNPKGNQPWTSTGRTDAEAEAPILWPPDEKSWH